MADTYFPSTTGLPETADGSSQYGTLNVDDPVDRYVVEAMIGEGATAQVYRVRHRLLGTRHALKVLRSRHPELRERLVQEGRIQAGLRHANVVPVTDVLDVYGHLGLLMDYVEGGALDTWLASATPSLDVSLQIFRGILSGVAAAHRMGIVHRDLKPANVLFDPERLHPWVTDFGLARHLHTDDERKTQVGQLMGTPAYMAPEQIRSSRDADARADIFALGAILYEMVTGQRAFSGTLYQVLAKVEAGEFVPPRRLVPDLPPAVEQAILGCLTVHPQLRLATCDAVLELLIPAGAAQPQLSSWSSPPPPPASTGPTEGLPWSVLQLDTDESGNLTVLEVDASDGQPQPRRVLRSVTTETLATLRAQIHRRPTPTAQSVGHGRLSLLTSVLKGLTLADRSLGDAEALMVRIDARSDTVASFPWEGLAAVGETPSQRSGAAPSAALSGARNAQSSKMNRQGAGNPALERSRAGYARTLLGSTSRAIEWTRAVPSSRPVVPRELAGPVRVLQLVDRVDPNDPLQHGLASLEASGHLAWLPAQTIAGLNAQGLAALLQTPPRPHVLLLRTAVGVDASGQLRVGLDGHGDRRGGMSLTELSAALDRRVGPDLRVVIVEPRYRGNPPGLVPALVDLAGDAATAGVFWPWNVPNDDLTRALQAFLEELAQRGDVVAAMRALRAAAIGPATTAMLAMRGTDPVVFDTSRRTLRPSARPDSRSHLSAGEAQIFEHLAGVLGNAGGYSLFLGSGLRSDGPSATDLALCEELQDRLEARDHSSLAQLMQRFELLEDREELRALVQEVLEDTTDTSAVGAVEAVAKMAQPGLHLSLTLVPVLADALALHHPDVDVVVLQPLRPGEFDRLRAFVRPAGGRRWRRAERSATQRLDLQTQHVVLRLHGGIPVPGKGMLGDPVLTETDQLDHLGALDTLPTQILAHFRRNPVVFLGFSPDNWSHRATVRGLAGGQPLASGSLAVLLPQADALHRRYWTWERGPAGSRGVQLVLASELDAIAKGLRASSHR